MVVPAGKGELVVDKTETPNLETSQQEWWRAVCSIADLVAADRVDPDEDALIRKELAGRGFSNEGIVKAMDWVDRAALSGSLMDTLGMLRHVSSCVRIPHAIERVSLPPKLLRSIDRCRRAGWLGAEVVEQLIETLRTIDTRDWGETEIRDLVGQVIGASGAMIDSADLTKILAGKEPGNYN